MSFFTDCEIGVIPYCPYRSSYCNGLVSFLKLVSATHDFSSRRAKFLLSLAYLLLYLLPPIPCESYRIVLSPCSQSGPIEDPSCYKGADEILKITLTAKGSSTPSSTTEQDMCGVDPTVDEGRLLGEWNSVSVFTFFNARSSNAAPYDKTTVFEAASLGPADGQLVSSTTAVNKDGLHCLFVAPPMAK